LTLKWRVRFSLFIGILLCEKLFSTHATRGARALRPYGCRRQPQCRPLPTFRLGLCWPMASGLPVGKRRFRHIAVSWAALGQATACQYLCICGGETKAQGCVESLFAGSRWTSKLQTVLDTEPKKAHPRISW